MKKSVLRVIVYVECDRRFVCVCVGILWSKNFVIIME